jgi:DNA-3-methyladenine glycosylase I
LWEKLVLDGFQAGLSWITILKKRDAFRAAFSDFDPYKVAEYSETDIERCLQNSGIVRHRGKIESAIKGARAWQKIEADTGFDNYLWGFVDGAPLQTNFKSMADVPPFTDLSTMISKDLKKRGFNFCGPTIVYAFMEAVGMANDHIVGCPRHEAVKQMSKRS